MGYQYENSHQAASTMDPTYVVHIAAGTASLAAGYVALYSTKGAPLHRRAGMVFVYAMLTMGAFGIAIAVTRGVAPALNVSAGTLTIALVLSALTTLRPTSPATRALDMLAMLAVFAVGTSNLFFGIEAAMSPRGLGRDGMPAFPFFMFGVVASLAFLGDVRVARAGRLQGASRIARHLWRMSFALFIAALSFFIGQAKVIPEPIRIRPLLALPVLAVLVTMSYWLWRVRFRKTLRGLVTLQSPSRVAKAPTLT
jgi:hypothetical protein